jgi:hypothetical protein
VGHDGIKRILQVTLNEEEKVALHHCAEVIREVVVKIDWITFRLLITIRCKKLLPGKESVRVQFLHDTLLCNRGKG